MRPCLFFSVLFVVLAAVGASGGDPQATTPQVDAAALEKRLADLERRSATMQKELQD